MVQLNWGVATDVGCVRGHNEDALLADASVFVVADGMGGHAAGEVASGIVVRRFQDLASAHERTPDAVADCISSANTDILAVAKATGRMVGTTAVGLVQVKQGEADYWLGFNVGDSRLYRLADGDLEQISTDHSQVQELVDSGDISESDARTDSRRHIVTRALGTTPPPEPDYWLLPVGPAQRFLLCSDGLTGELQDDEVAQVMRDVAEPSLVAARLVERAIAAGGRDNVTAVVVDVLSVDAQEVSVDELTSPRLADGDAAPEIEPAPSMPANRGGPVIEAVPVAPVADPPASNARALIDGVPHG